MKISGLDLKFDFDETEDEHKFNALVEEVNYKIAFFVFPILFCLYFLLSLFDLFSFTHIETSQGSASLFRLIFGLLLLGGFGLSFLSFAYKNAHWIQMGIFTLGSLVTSGQYAQTDDVTSLWFHFGYLLLGMSTVLLIPLKPRVIYMVLLTITWVVPYWIFRPQDSGLNFQAFVVFSIAATVCGMLGQMVYLLFRSLAVQASFVRGTLSKYLSKEVTEAVLTRAEARELSGEERQVTVLMSDLQGYSTISEHLPPHKVITVLNQYFRRMQDVINSYNGCVIEFLGDGLLVVFNAPENVPNHAEMAMKCAVDMVKALHELNLEWKGVRHEPEGRTSDAALWLRESSGTVRCRVGIHTGMVIAGNIGSETRMKYGVVGDVVNVAARLEGLNKQYGSDIMISADSYVYIPSELREQLSHQGPLKVKGREEGVDTYSLTVFQSDEDMKA